MAESLLLSEVRRAAYEKLHDDPSGHDFYHVERVANLCRYLAEKNNADVNTCVIAGYLHDYCRPEELQSGEPHYGPKALETIRSLLDTFSLPSWQSDCVLLSIAEHESYVHLGDEAASSLESRILQDADRLDAIGAIGIARTFMFTGAVGGLMFDPTRELENRDADTAIAYFHNMLLRLPETLYTAQARELAAERSAVLLSFLDAFYGQWFFGSEPV